MDDMIRLSQLYCIGDDIQAHENRFRQTLDTYRTSLGKARQGAALVNQLVSEKDDKQVNHGQLIEISRRLTKRGRSNKSKPQPRQTRSQKLKEKEETLRTSTVYMYYDKIDTSVGTVLKTNPLVCDFVNRTAPRDLGPKPQVPFKSGGEDMLILPDVMEEDKELDEEPPIAKQPEKLVSASIQSSKALADKSLKGNSVKVSPVENLQTGTNDNNANKEAVFRQPAELPPLQPCYPKKTLPSKEFSLLPSLGQTKPSPAEGGEHRQSDEGVARALVIMAEQMRILQTSIKNQADQIYQLTDIVNKLTERLDGVEKQGFQQQTTLNLPMQVQDIFGAPSGEQKGALLGEGLESHPIVGEDERAKFMNQLKDILDSFSLYDSENAETYRKLCLLLKGKQCHKIVSETSMRQKLTSAAMRNKILEKVMQELGISAEEKLGLKKEGLSKIISIFK